MGRLNCGKTPLVAFLLCATTAIALRAQTFSTLQSFDGADGSNPYAALVQGTDGSLYGTTELGGANRSGMVFKISLSGTLTTLYSFGSQSDCADGAQPFSALLLGTNGNFYGTTYFGGANGAGEVFTMTPSGTLTTLYSFCSQSGCTDGEYPYAALVQATDGDFYGTTVQGGAGNAGTVFRITPTGAFATLYSFCSQSSCTDGEYPFAGLLLGADQNFYGTTTYGGAHGFGTVFKITSGGTLTTLHSFDSADGAYPEAALVQALNGNFYGTTFGGGVDGGGTVFKITSGGTLTTLHSFDGTDGEILYAGLVQASDENLYGTTESGGANGLGTAFKITPSGTLTTLYSFCSQSGCADGEYPYAGLVQDTNGTFYGTTTDGGATSDGMIFSLSVGLSPFVKTQPASGKAGVSVKILGTNLTGATSVSFNGTAAVFTVVSSSEITTAVPAGATTGKVQVVTPSGTLSSNVSFRVLQ